MYFLLCLAGIFHRILGHFCNHGCRTIRNQPAGYCGHDDTQYGSWCFAADESAFPESFSKKLGLEPCSQRHHYRDHRYADQL